MSNEKSRIVEVQGVKMELDMREGTVTNVDTYRVGDSVKVLTKQYNDNYTSHIGTIIGFDQFPDLPTICIAYLELGYSDVEIKYVYVNDKSKEDIKLAPLNKFDKPLTREEILNKFDKKIEVKEDEIIDLKRKKALFLTQFAKYFKDYEDFISEGAQIQNK